MNGIAKKVLLTLFLSLIFNTYCQEIDLYPVEGLSTEIIDHINNLFEATCGIKEVQNVPILKHSIKAAQQKKSWTLLIYIAADNDLRNFALRNLKQMAAIGSTEHINIVVHLDIKLSGDNKVTKRYLIQKDKIIHLNADDPKTQRMDSGNPETLISFLTYGVTQFPADNFAFIAWNHGLGELDPRKGKVFKLSELFVYNKDINKVEINRNIGLLDLIMQAENDDKGICWDGTTGNYLSTQDLDYALNKIYTTVMKNKKFAIIGFDACLMQMIGVAHVIKKYADIMIGSEEAILGTGWNYFEILKPFTKKTLSTEEFARHIVSVYRETYEPITNDFTLSAIKLKDLHLLENSLNYISSILVECLKKQKNKSVKNAITKSLSKPLCTHFDEPSFIDLHHFLKNLSNTTKNFILINKGDENRLIPEITRAINKCCQIIEEITLANTVGKNLEKAKGIAIYFPTNKIYPSYRNLEFCKNNDWIVFLTHYLNS